MSVLERGQERAGQAAATAEPASPPSGGRAPPGPGPDLCPARTGTVLTGHIVFTLINAALFANVAWIVPLLVRLRFGSDTPHVKDWQTVLVTAAVPISLIFSIFWNAVLARVRLRTYLILFWLAAVLPLGCVSLVQSYWQLLACHIVAAVGLAGWAPANGKLLKHFYSDAIRGRAYAALNMAALAGGIVAVFAVGKWLEADPGAFRVYFPAVALAQLVGIELLLRLARFTRTVEPTAAPRWSWADLLAPVLNMRAVLRTDRTFLRYEAAFMTYGAAFMVCDALLPVLGTDRLGMRYEDYSHSTQMIGRIAMLVVTLPMGLLLDRIGPIRTSGIAFAVLTAYPLLLLAAGGPAGVGLASIFWGVGLAGVQMGWMLGPLSLAGTPDEVPQYVSIHATLVGVRGLFFQGLGMAVYLLSGSFTWPLLAAAGAFLWAATQMWRLHVTLRPAGEGPAGPIPRPGGTPAPTGIAREP